MCLIVFAWDFHEEYKLVLAANRDEEYKRKSMKVTFWEDAPGIVAGRDLQAGGTWMGIHENWKFSAITNFRNPKLVKPNAPTRGFLPLNYLRSQSDPLAYLKLLQQNDGEKYNGFNLLTGDQDGLYHYNNVNNKITKVERGVHALSNATLDTSWPKVDRAKEKLKRELSYGFDELSLLEMMYDIEKAPDGDLPKTGVTLKWEKELSPMFIKTPEYGTVSSSVLLVDRANRVTFAERTYSKATGICKDQTLKFELKIKD